MTIMAKIRENVAVTPDGCWIWTRSCSGSGYGSLRWGEYSLSPHRAAWEAMNGPVPDGLVLDHFMCDQPLCANPQHLRPVTRRENTLRSEHAPAAVNARKTHCLNGHELTPENTYPSPGERKCKICSRERARQYRRRRNG